MDLTQADVAKILNYKKPQFISNIERGVAGPPPFLLGRLAEIYQIPHEDMAKYVAVLVYEQIMNERKLSPPKS